MKDTPGRSDESLPVRRSQAPPVTPPPLDYADDYQAEAAAPAAGKRVSFRLVARALRRHWWQALLLWTAGTAGLVTFAYTKIMPTYDAISQVKVDFDNPQIFGAGGQQFDPQQFMRNQVETIKSPKIIGAALAANPELNNSPLLKGATDPEVEIRNALRVGMVPSTSLIQAEMSSPTPAEAATLVNAVIKAYLDYAHATYDTSTQKRIKLLKDTLDEQRREVEKHRTIVQTLADQVGVAGAEALADRTKTTMESYKLWSDQLTNVSIQVIKANIKLEMLRNTKEVPQQQPGEQLTSLVREMFLSNPAVENLQGRITQAVEKRNKVERVVKNKADPAFVNADARVKELNAQREELWRQLEPALRRQLAASPVDASLDKEIKDAEIDLAGKTQEENKLKDMLEKVRVNVKGQEAESIKLEQARRDLQRKESVLDRIESSLSQTQFDARNPTAQVELFHPATPSLKPNSDRRRQVMAAAPVVTGLLVVGLLMLLELRGGRVSDPDELTARMHLQVIGVVPPLPQIRVGPAGGNAPGLPASAGDIRAQRQLDEFVQSLDHLRVALCARRDPWGRDRHCVLITSACGSEGKTTLAAQLAERCVNAGLMTLLIDADLRNPTLSRMLDAAENPGLINVLRGEMKAEDVVMVIGDAGGFHLLPAGTPRVDPSRLLQSERLGKLIAQARESFDMIIVDAPPVLPVPDALTIGRWTDGAVLAVRYDTSRFPLVERANRRLARVGVPVIGAVVNGVRSMESTYGGYYGYGSTVYGSAPTASVED